MGRDALHADIDAIVNFPKIRDFGTIFNFLARVNLDGVLDREDCQRVRTLTTGSRVCASGRARRGRATREDSGRRRWGNHILLINLQASCRPRLAR